MNEAVAALSREVASAVGEGPDSQRRKQLRDRIVRQAQTAVHRRVAPAVFWAGAILAVASFALFLRLPAPLIRCWVEGTDLPVAEKAELEAPVSAALTVHFEDETRVTLDPGSRGVVDRASRNGVHISLRDGTLEAAVVHTGRIDWTFAVGAYELHVTGTRFLLAWNEVTNAAQLTMQDGAIVVSGALLPAEGLVVHSGQAVSLGRNDWHWIERTDAVVDMPAAASPARHESVSRPLVPPVTGPPDWQALAARGDYQKAIMAARRHGIDVLEKTLDAATLSRLADVARFAREADDAERLLQALARRFGGTDAAREVPFQLGRVVMDLKHDPSAAIPLLETYVRDPGPAQFREEALGRLMGAYADTFDVPQAERVAREYVRRYPRGSYAAVAGKILAR